MLWFNALFMFCFLFNMWAIWTRTTMTCQCNCDAKLQNYSFFLYKKEEEETLMLQTAEETQRLTKSVNEWNLEVELWCQWVFLVLDWFASRYMYCVCTLWDVSALWWKFYYLSKKCDGRHFYLTWWEVSRNGQNTWSILSVLGYRLSFDRLCWEI